MANSSSTQLAKHLHDVFFGGNWTFSNLKDNVAGLNWQQAIAKPEGFNSIALLVFHIDYFLVAAIQVLEGGPLDANDKYSFDLPEINSKADWEALLNTSFQHAERLSYLIAQLPDSKLWEVFVEEKYGNYYRNILGIIEHTHYHLGQIALVRKLLDNAK